MLSLQADLCLGNSLFYVTDEASCFGVPDGLVRMQGQVTGHPGMPAIIQIKWSVANAGLVSVAQRFFSETTVTNRTVKNEVTPSWSVDMTLVVGASIFTSIEDRVCCKIRMKDMDE
ncbi:TPA: hypothetical protein ACH3X2_002628 [Trebouxia sp. C0005]